MVMSSGAVPLNASAPLEFYWEPLDETTQYYMYMHFAELQQLQSNQSRAFEITLNGKLWYEEPFSPSYLESGSVFSTSASTASNFSFSLVQVKNSTLPPILNAIEVYRVIEFPQPETEQDDGMLSPPHVSLFFCFYIISLSLCMVHDYLNN